MCYMLYDVLNNVEFNCVTYEINVAFELKNGVQSVYYVKQQIFLIYLQLQTRISKSGERTGKKR